MRSSAVVPLALSLVLLPALAAAQDGVPGRAPAGPPAADFDPTRVLEEYVKRPQPAYGWRVKESESQPGGVTIHQLELTSQEWQGLTWKHRLNVVVPQAPKGDRARPGHALLLITGSSGVQEHILIVSAMAHRLGVPVGILHDVPNQPLFREETASGRGMREDALIAYTFGRYMETHDPDWPALLPMTRAAMAGMDAMGELSDRLAADEPEWAFGRLEKFVTTGASKRGWTTWLSAVVDPRVIGIAPIVFDNLNFEAQIALHLEVWGKPSPSIRDYTDSGLLELLGTPRGRELVQVVDPFAYRASLDLPKMVLLGTNDTYWPLESIHLYRGVLPGELYCHYVPNAGHGGGPSLIQAVAGFFDHVTGRIASLPDVEMTVTPRQAAVIRAPKAEDVQAVRLWTARVPERDFTQASWEITEARAGADGWRAALPEGARQGETGRAAFIGEVELRDSSGATFTIHSPVQVWELAPAR